MSIWAKIFSERYDDAIAQLAELVKACPDEHWSAPVWRVRRTDRHVWPVVSGMGGDLADDDRLQLHAAFWNVVVHALHALDIYLDGGVTPADPPPPFDTWQMPGHFLPEEPPTRQQLLDYVGALRTKAHRVLDDLTDAEVARPARRGRPFGDLLVHELVHLGEHNAQLEQFLNARMAWSNPAWSTDDRWFGGCEHCAPDDRQKVLGQPKT
ncbi:MAG: DinB family protein [Acidimicrobiales bacterium]